MDNSSTKKDIETGKKIFEDIPSDLQPAWAGLILSRFSKFVKKVPEEILAIFEIIDEPKKWKQAHAQFLEIRIFNLTNKNIRPESYFILAEKVAKITYNSSNSSAPFDKDSGWYIPRLSIQSAEYFADAKLINQVNSDILLFLDNKNLRKDFQTSILLLKEMRNTNNI